MLATESSHASSASLRSKARSLIYVATDFGRSKSDRGGLNDTTFGTGHDLNNGVVILSPKSNGGKILGGINPKTAQTYGFDPTTGTPNRTRKTSESEIFSGILSALKVNTEGSSLPSVPAMYKA